MKHDRVGRRAVPYGGQAAAVDMFDPTLSLTKATLFLAHRIPYPPDRGDKIRSWNMLKRLAEIGRVHLACFADDERDAAHLGALREALGGRLGHAHVEVRRRNKAVAVLQAVRTGRPLSLTLFDSPAMHRFVQAMLQQSDVETVFAFSGQMAQFVPPGIKKRFIMDFVDVDSAKFADYSKSGLLRLVHAREARTLLAFERATAARAQASLFVSEAEAELFRSRAGAARVHAVSNGIDLDYYDPRGDFPRLPAAAGPLIVFTGQMDYRPNAEAVQTFAEAALPQLLESRPDLRFAIVGRNPAPAVLRLAKCAGVTVTGAVPDVRSWIAAADVVVAPLRIARGIQNKVLEAMAMARPVVASSAAFEGIEAEPGRDLLVADTAQDQAAAILGLLRDPDAAAALGAAARARMEVHYAWNARLAPIGALIDQPSRKAAA